MSILDLITVAVYALALAIFYWVYRRTRARQRTRLEEVARRVAEHERLGAADTEAVYLQDREQARRFLKPTPPGEQAAGLLRMGPRALEFHGEDAQGECQFISLSREQVRVAWVGNKALKDRQNYWIRISDGSQTYFVAPPPATKGLRQDEGPARALLDRLRRWANQRDAPDLTETSGPVSVLAVLSMAVMIVSVGALLYFSSQLGSISGPSHVAVDQDGHVYVVLDREIHQLDRHGQPVRTVGFKELGIDASVSDLVWHGGHIYLGLLGQGQIRRCSLEERFCGEGLLKGSEETRPLHTFKFAMDDAAERIWISDTARHRLLVYGSDGANEQTVGTAEASFCYPNGLDVDDQGRLLVADTNNHRVVVLLFVEGRQVRTDQVLAVVLSAPTYSRCGNAGAKLASDDAFWSRILDYQSTSDAVSLAAAGPGRVWPTDVVQDRVGRLWVINARNNMRDGVVLRFADRRAEPEAVALPKYADPVSLAPLNDGVLVADFEGHRVWLVREDLSYEHFATGALAAKLERLRDQRSRLQLYKLLAWNGIGLAAFLIAITLAVYLLSMRRRIFAADA